MVTAPVGGIKPREFTRTCVRADFWTIVKNRTQDVVRLIGIFRDLVSGGNLIWDATNCNRYDQSLRLLRVIIGKLLRPTDAVVSLDFDLLCLWRGTIIPSLYLAFQSALYGTDGTAAAILAMADVDGLVQRLRASHVSQRQKSFRQFVDEQLEKGCPALHSTVRTYGSVNSKSFLPSYDALSGECRHDLALSSGQSSASEELWRWGSEWGLDMNGRFGQCSDFLLKKP